MAKIIALVPAARSQAVAALQIGTLIATLGVVSVGLRWAMDYWF